MPRLVVEALRRQGGPRRAEQMAARGALLSPDEALAAGLVDAVVPGAEVVADALDRAAELVGLPSAAMSATRRQARADLVELAATVDDSDYATMTDVWFEPDTQAALAAMVAKLRSR